MEPCDYRTGPGIALIIEAIAVTLVCLALVSSASASMPARFPVVAADVRYEPCPGNAGYLIEVAGCTWPGGPVYVTDPSDRFMLYHELGHQFDYRAIGRGGEYKFARMTRHAHEAGIGPRSWDDVAEEFADAYATCAFGWRPRPGEWGDLGHHFPTGYAYDPSPRVQRAVCAMIERAGRRAGL